MSQADPQPDWEFLDSDVICRYLLNDHPANLSRRAARAIESGNSYHISILILAEVAHVLRSVYSRSPADIAGALIQLLERENIAAHEIETEIAIEAMELTR